ncbi:RNase P modulator RnpM [Oceanobacillus kapialis]|uniref:RNase P modulator RnpM n=1 Tax=Oceanobacillus kapialis TaxID=481353 RepID=A0ABW5PYK5_9BACI
MVQKRKVPERKCVVTNEMKPKKQLIRVVRNKDGEVFVDETGKKNGRGAYLTKDLEIIRQAEKTGVLNRQLNTEVDASIYEELIKLVQGKHHE